MNEWANKSINVKPSTKERLDMFISAKERTYDKVIQKLLDFYDENS